jgi:GTP-binding protein HflX
MIVDVTLYANAVPVSATQRTNLDTLMRAVAEVITQRMVRMQSLIPFNRGDLVELFHSRGQVYRQSETENGTLITGAIPRALAPVFGPLRVDPERGRRRAFVIPAIDLDALGEATDEDMESGG